ncbi:MAG: glycosyltransferase family 4 protein [Patescibacteria group bacterium]
MDSTSKLRVGFVLDDGLDSPDGVQQYVLAMGEWLRKQGHEVLYLAGQTARQDIAGVHSLSRNIGVRSNGNYLTIPLPSRRSHLNEFLRVHEIDVLHVQTPYSPLMGGRLVELANKDTAVIGTFHILPNSWLISLGTRLLGLWCRRSLRRFDKMLSVSPAAAEFANKKFGVLSTVLPNVIDYQRFHYAKPLSKYDDSTLTILFLGRLVPRKGCLLLLEAVAEIVGKPGMPKFRVVICGKGPLQSKLERFVDEHDLGEVVEFVGFVSESDKPSYYASADISAFPSSGGESFGIVLLEAMASGKAAVLAGDNPGYHSVMHQRTELLFDPKSKFELAEKLEEQLLNKDARRNNAEWGANYTVDFDVNVAGSKLIDIYNEALRKRAKL